MYNDVQLGNLKINYLLLKLNRKHRKMLLSLRCFIFKLPSCKSLIHIYLLTR